MISPESHCPANMRNHNHRLNLPMNTMPAFPSPWVRAAARLLPLLLLVSAAQRLSAQDANWTGTTGEWNDPTKWDVGVVPGETTNVFLPATAIVSYNQPMAAPSIGGVTNWGTLAINTNGFNAAAVVLNLTTGAGRLTVNDGGVLAITGALGMCSNNAATVQPGGTLSASTAIHIGSNPFGTTGGSTVGAFAKMTNNGGTITTPSTTFNPNNQSLGTGNHPLFVINGGINNLGYVDIHRVGGTSQSALGTEGLMIYGGIVNLTQLRLGNNSFGSMLISPGSFVTNTGNGLIRNATAGRPSRLLQTGGFYVTLGTQQMTVSTGTGSGTTYAITGGTNLMGGLQFGDGSANPGTANFTNAAHVYLGAGGIANSGAAVVNARLNDGGLFGATADWTGSSPMVLNGGVFTFQTADLNGTARNITLSGVLSGPGTLRKTGLGTLTIESANTYSGQTWIEQGTLALGPSGSIGTSLAILVGTNGLLDVSGVSGGFTHAATRILGGWGTVNGNVTLASGAIVDPGTNAAPGTLTLNNNLTLTGTGVLRFDLPTTPGPGNDKLVIGGNLNVSGANSIEVTGGGSPGTTHALIQYGGAFSGSLASFTVIGVSGTLSNDVAGKTIYLTVTSAIRGPTNVVWIGNPVVNEWDVANRTNWLNAGVLDFFVTGDQVRFDATGAANPNVLLPVAVNPSTVTVDAAANYTLTGPGGITGLGGLTKTNTGTFTLNVNNSFTGPVNLLGGTLAVPTVADGGVDSPLGASAPAPGNLTINNATLRYTGSTASSDRGATLGAGGATLEVTAPASTLTLGGTLTGPGLLKKTGPGTLSLAGTANDYAGGTLVQNGTLRITATANVGPGGITNIGSRLLVGGAVTIGSVLHFTSNAVVDLNNVGGNTALNGAWSGDGYVLITNQQNNTRVFTIGGNGSGGGTMWNFTGTVDMGECPGTLRFNDGGSTGSGPNFGSSNAVFNLGTSTATLIVRNGGTVNHLGALLGGPSTRLSGRGSSAGTVTYHVGGKNTDATFAGIIQDTDTPGGQLTAIVKVGTGKWTLTGNSTHTGSTVIEAGTLAVNGTLGNSTVTVNGGLLAGTGSLDGQVFVQSGGTLSPGTSLGTLTINNTLHLAGNVLAEVSKGVGNDVVVANAVNYGGTLTLTNIGAPLVAGDAFTLFNTASPSGDFATLAGSPGPGLAWSFDPLTGVATVVTASAPPTLNVTRAGNNLDFSWTGSFKLQSQTNSRATGLGTNWFDYPGGGTSPVTVPMNLTNQAVFFRLSSP